MKKFKKWSVRILSGLLILVLIFFSINVWAIFKAWPKVDGTIEINNKLQIKVNSSNIVEPVVSLDKTSVKIIRDKWGVPNIYADNEYDLFFAQGYVHAQDRLWQMEMNRRAGSGTLSEMFGKMGIEMDSSMRDYGLLRSAEKTWAQLDAESKFILEAYSDGVNFFIDSHSNSLPVEYTVFGIKAKLWSPLDTLVVGNMMSFYMSYNHLLEVMRAKIIANNGSDVINDLFPYLTQGVFVIPEESNGYQNLKNTIWNTPEIVSNLMTNPFDRWGSNNWVVSGKLTKTGKPFLANDTHLTLTMPSTWYENGLHGGRFDVIGFGLPGIPLIIMGHNQHISWGITNMNSDVQDLFLEKVDNVESPTCYEFQGEWRELKIITEKIEVKGEDPVDHQVYVTHHGPIVNNALGIPMTQPMSLSWVLNEGSMLIKAIIKLSMASNWGEFRGALESWDDVCQNFVYADVDGNIGYQAACKVPIRMPKNSGLIPVPGWTGEYEWQGFIPFAELPSIFNPKQGYIVTTNNKITPDDYPYLISYDWALGDRAERISDLLEVSGQLTIEEMIKIQGDNLYLLAEKLCPYILTVESKNAVETEALEILKNWDYTYESDSTAAAIFEAWYTAMLKNIFAKKLGLKTTTSFEETMGSYLSYPDLHQPAVLNLMTKPDSLWFDDQETPEVEQRDDIIVKSLTDGIAELSAKYGEDPKKWRWGRMHKVTFLHMPFGASGIGIVEKIFNSRAISAPGSLSTVNMAQYAWNQPYEVTFGTSQRMVIDMSDLDKMIAINSTGQSGLLFHKNRKDQITMWRDLEYRPVYNSRNMIEEAGKKVLMLEFSR